MNDDGTNIFEALMTALRMVQGGFVTCETCPAVAYTSIEKPPIGWVIIGGVPFCDCCQVEIGARLLPAQ